MFGRLEVRFYVRSIRRPRYCCTCLSLCSGYNNSPIIEIHYRVRDLGIPSEGDRSMSARFHKAVKKLKSHRTIQFVRAYPVCQSPAFKMAFRHRYSPAIYSDFRFLSLARQFVVTFHPHPLPYAWYLLCLLCSCGPLLSFDSIA